MDSPIINENGQTTVTSNSMDSNGHVSFFEILHLVRNTNENSVTKNQIPEINRKFENDSELCHDNDNLCVPLHKKLKSTVDGLPGISKFPNSFKNPEPKNDDSCLLGYDILKTALKKKDYFSVPLSLDDSLRPKRKITKPKGYEEFWHDESVVKDDISRSKRTPKPKSFDGFWQSDVSNEGKMQQSKHKSKRSDCSRERSRNNNRRNRIVKNITTQSTENNSPCDIISQNKVPFKIEEAIKKFKPDVPYSFNSVITKFMEQQQNLGKLSSIRADFDSKPNAFPEYVNSVTLGGLSIQKISSPVKNKDFKCDRNKKNKINIKSILINKAAIDEIDGFKFVSFDELEDLNHYTNFCRKKRLKMLKRMRAYETASEVMNREQEKYDDFSVPEKHDDIIFCDLRRTTQQQSSVVIGVPSKLDSGELTSKTESAYSLSEYLSNINPVKDEETESQRVNVRQLLSKFKDITYEVRSRALDNKNETIEPKIETDNDEGRFISGNNISSSSVESRKYITKTSPPSFSEKSSDSISAGCSLNNTEKPLIVSRIREEVRDTLETTMSKEKTPEFVSISEVNETSKSRKKECFKKTNSVGLRKPNKLKQHQNKKKKTPTECVYNDPYCVDITKLNTSCADNICKRANIILYLGVDRPLFPVLYHNLLLVNNKYYPANNDTLITNLFANFALSTLVTNLESNVVKKIMVPILHSELSSYVQYSASSGKLFLPYNAVTSKHNDLVDKQENRPAEIITKINTDNKPVGLSKVGSPVKNFAVCTAESIIIKKDSVEDEYCSRIHGQELNYIARNCSDLYKYILSNILERRRYTFPCFKNCRYVRMTEDEDSSSILDVERTNLEIDIEDVNANFQDCDETSDMKYTIPYAKWMSDIITSNVKTGVYNRITKVTEPFVLSESVRWLIILVENTFTSIVCNKKEALFYSELIEILYRAELSKSVYSYKMDFYRSKYCMANNIDFGAYAFPGLPELILLGPYDKTERHNLAGIRESKGRRTSLTFRNTALRPFYRDDLFNMYSITSKNEIAFQWWEPFTYERKACVNELFLNSFFKNINVLRCNQQDEISNSSCTVPNSNSNLPNDVRKNYIPKNKASTNQEWGNMIESDDITIEYERIIKRKKFDNIKNNVTNVFNNTLSEVVYVENKLPSGNLINKEIYKHRNIPELTNALNKIEPLVNISSCPPEAQYVPKYEHTKNGIILDEIKTEVIDESDLLEDKDHRYEYSNFKTNNDIEISFGSSSPQRIEIKDKPYENIQETDIDNSDTSKCFPNIQFHNSILSYALSELNDRSKKRSKYNRLYTNKEKKRKRSNTRYENYHGQKRIRCSTINNEIEERNTELISSDNLNIWEPTVPYNNIKAMEGDVENNYFKNGIFCDSEEELNSPGSKIGSIKLEADNEDEVPNTHGETKKNIQNINSNDVNDDKIFILEERGNNFSEQSKAVSRGMIPRGLDQQVESANSLIEHGDVRIAGINYLLENSETEDVRENKKNSVFRRKYRTRPDNRTYNKDENIINLLSEYSELSSEIDHDELFNVIPAIIKKLKKKCNILKCKKDIELVRATNLRQKYFSLVKNVGPDSKICDEVKQMFRLMQQMKPLCEYSMSSSDEESASDILNEISGYASCGEPVSKYNKPVGPMIQDSNEVIEDCKNLVKFSTLDHNDVQCGNGGNESGCNEIQFVNVKVEEYDVSNDQDNIEETVAEHLDRTEKSGKVCDESDEIVNENNDNGYIIIDYDCNDNQNWKTGVSHGKKYNANVEDCKNLVKFSTLDHNDVQSENGWNESGCNEIQFVNVKVEEYDVSNDQDNIEETVAEHLDMREKSGKVYDESDEIVNEHNDNDYIIIDNDCDDNQNWKTGLSHCKKYNANKFSQDDIEIIHDNAVSTSLLKNPTQNKLIHVVDLVENQQVQQNSSRAKLISLVDLVDNQHGDENDVLNCADLAVRKFTKGQRNLVDCVKLHQNNEIDFSNEKLPQNSGIRVKLENKVCNLKKIRNGYLNPSENWKGTMKINGNNSQIVVNNIFGSEISSKAASDRCLRKRTNRINWQEILALQNLNIANFDEGTIKKKSKRQRKRPSQDTRRETESTHAYSFYVDKINRLEAVNGELNKSNKSHIIEVHPDSKPGVPEMLKDTSIDKSLIDNDLVVIEDHNYCTSKAKHKLWQNLEIQPPSWAKKFSDTVPVIEDPTDNNKDAYQNVIDNCAVFVDGYSTLIEIPADEPLHVAEESKTDPKYNDNLISKTGPKYDDNLIPKTDSKYDNNMILKPESKYDDNMILKSESKYDNNRILKPKSKYDNNLISKHDLKYDNNRILKTDSVQNETSCFENKQKLETNSSYKKNKPYYKTVTKKDSGHAIGNKWDLLLRKARDVLEFEKAKSNIMSSTSLSEKLKRTIVESYREAMGLNELDIVNANLMQRKYNIFANCDNYNNCISSSNSSSEVQHDKYSEKDCERLNMSDNDQSDFEIANNQKSKIVQKHDSKKYTVFEISDDEKHDSEEYTIFELAGGHEPAINHDYVISDEEDIEGRNSESNSLKQIVEEFESPPVRRHKPNLLSKRRSSCNLSKMFHDPQCKNPNADVESIEQSLLPMPEHCNLNI